MKIREGELEGPDRVIVISEEVLSGLRSAPSILRRSHIRFLLAYSGAEALSLARASDPSLVLLDFALPVLRADQVCRELKTSPKLRDVPIVIVGPALPPHFEQSCRQAGCTAYLYSPVDYDALSSLLARIMGLTLRQATRFPVLLSVSHGTVTSQTLGRSRDLSLLGIRVRTLARFRKGFSISLRFPLDGEQSIITGGEVTRCVATEDGEYDLGIRFVGLSLEARDRLAEFISQRQA
jgi:CheY-like chemotaxis protein